MKALLRLTTLILAVWLIAFSSVNAQDFTDDFNDSDDAGWTRVDPINTATGGALSSTFSFPGGDSYRIQAVASPNPALVGASRVGAARLDISQTNFEVAVDVVDWDNSLPQGFGVVARAGDVGLGTTRGYLLTYFENSTAAEIAIQRIENEMVLDPESAAASDSFRAPMFLDPANDYRFVFSGVGTALRGQVFDMADLTNPVATLTAEDSTYTSGAPGLISAANLADLSTPTDVTFDNFTVTNIPEPASLTLLALAAAACLLNRKARGLPRSTTV